LTDPPVINCSDDLNRIDENLLNMIPDSSNKPYDIKDIILSILDNRDFLEVQKFFAQNIVVGFGRLNGKTVGIVANQPKVMAGVLDVNSADKGARFIRFCDSFNIPIVSFTDTAGYLPGTGQEYSGVIRHGAKMLYAFSEATVPKINVIVRKAYGGAYIAMNSKHLGADAVFAWPSAEIAVMGPEGAANIIFRKEIAAADDASCYQGAKNCRIPGKIFESLYSCGQGIRGRRNRSCHDSCRLINALEMLAGKRENRPAKKHGNIPL
jgi:acetyl-CoA carboxylase carboxyltransferase component